VSELCKVLPSSPLSHPLRFRCCCTKNRRSPGCSGERVRGRVEEFWVSNRTGNWILGGRFMAATVWHMTYLEAN